MGEGRGAREWVHDYELREIQNRKFAMVFLGGFIICAGGLDFIVEISDEFVFAVKAYLDIPFLLGFGPAYSSVFR